MLTIFGWSETASDVEALDIMTTARGEDRKFERPEIIDIKGETELREKWSAFIHGHHYAIRRDFFGSWIAMHPRRSCEAAWQQFFEKKSVSANPVPRIENLAELQAWFAPLLQVEAANRDTPEG
jgi:hypothetical protein